MPHTTTSRTRTLLRWLPAALMAAVIFAASSVPGTYIPGRFSVLGHLSEYAVFGLLLMSALRDRRTRTRTAAIIALIIVALYGASDELHQAFVPLRTPDPVDWLTDIAGAALGVAVWAVFARVRARARERQ